MPVAETNASVAEPLDHRALLVGLVAWGSLLLCGIATVLAVHGALVQKPWKADLAELQHVRHGLLNADAWSSQMADALTARLDSMDDDPAARAELKAALTNTIQAVLTQLELSVQDQDGLPFIGALSNRLMGALVASVRDDADRLADYAVDELAKPENQQRLHAWLRGRLPELIRQQRDPAIAAQHLEAWQALLARHACSEAMDCAVALEARIESAATRAWWLTWLALFFAAVATIVGLLQALGPRATVAETMARVRSSDYQIPVSAANLVLMLLPAFILLIGGLIAPMIEIRAVISGLAIGIGASVIEFGPQVLFFQNKSILDVITLLVTADKTHLIFVGVGIGLFSVVFPALKLTAVVLDRRRASSSQRPVWLAFLAYGASKWSMADVFVIALFLAFLGFDGLTEQQLSLITGSGENGEVAAAPMEINTRNGTALGPGFFLFGGFCLVSLAVGPVLASSMPTRR